MNAISFIKEYFESHFPMRDVVDRPVNDRTALSPSVYLAK